MHKLFISRISYLNFFRPSVTQVAKSKNLNWEGQLYCLHSLGASFFVFFLFICLFVCVFPPVEPLMRTLPWIVQKTENPGKSHF